MLSSKKLILVAMVSLSMSFVSGSAYGHTEMSTPVHRTGENIKVAPCGGAAPGAITAAYEPGKAITVTINEYIRHSGFFGFGVSNTPNPTSDADFTPLKNPNPPPTTNPYPLFMRPDIHILNTQTTSGKLTYTLALPTGFTCEKCVLQVIEYMMDAGATTAPTLYHSCTDISVKLGNALVAPAAAAAAPKCSATMPLSK